MSMVSEACETNKPVRIYYNENFVPINISAFVII